MKMPKILKKGFAEMFKALIDSDTVVASYYLKYNELSTGEMVERGRCLIVESGEPQIIPIADQLNLIKKIKSTNNG